jgi:hypothetical protein
MMSSSQSRFALVIATCLGRNLSKSDIHSLMRAKKMNRGGQIIFVATINTMLKMAMA